jgi:hypothetical protein
MRTPWQWMIGAAIVLSAGAFTVGALTGSDIDVPAERAPIVIRDAETSTGPIPERAASGGQVARPPRASSPAPGRPAAPERGAPERGAPERGAPDRGGRDDDRVEVVNPSPDQIETADDDAGRDDEPDDDGEGDDD